MSQEALTLVSTTCIVLSGACLLLGWYRIRSRHDRAGHRNAMLVATACAGAFLVAYVARWSLFGSKPFAGTGAWRSVYLATLTPHIILAIALGPLAIRLIYLALGKQDFVRHRRLARITLPIWLFVAASGWAIYFMLYRMRF